MTTRRTAVALFGICVGLAACTTVFYEKHGAKTADVTQDFLECQEAARETRVDRVSSVSVKMSGQKLAPLFDGSEQLISVTSIPWYSRQVFLPAL